MEYGMVVAKAADEHPTASFVLGVVVVVIAAAAAWWLIGKIFK